MADLRPDDDEVLRDVLERESAVDYVYVVTDYVSPNEPGVIVGPILGISASRERMHRHWRSCVQDRVDRGLDKYVDREFREEDLVLHHPKDSMTLGEAWFKNKQGQTERVSLVRYPLA